MEFVCCYTHFKDDETEAQRELIAQSQQLGTGRAWAVLLWTPYSRIGHFAALIWRKEASLSMV